MSIKGNLLDLVVREIRDGFDPRFDPRKREADRINSLLTEKVTSDAPEIPRVPLSSLEGRDFITSMSDRTDAGGALRSINGVELETPLMLRGGQDYMFENPGKVWASGKTPVTQIMNAAGGEDILYMPWRMAPTGGDFSNMTGEAMLSYAQANMDSGTKKALDQMISAEVPYWPGINSDEAIEMWPTLSADMRKKLKNDMDVKFRDRGGLSIGEARLSVTDPRQINARDGGIMNIGEIHGSKPRITDNDHPSYPDAVPGEGIGYTDQDVGIFELLPDVVKERGIPDPLNPRATDLRALQMKPYKGTVTPEALEALQKRGVDVGNIDPKLLTTMGLTSAAAVAALGSRDAEAGVALGLAKNVDMDRLVSAWQKAVSRQPDIDPSTHLQNIIHNKEFTNYDDFGTYARKKDGGKNGDTYFNELKPFLIDISKHPKVKKDMRLKRGLTQYADSRFVQRKKAGKQSGEATLDALLPVAGVGLAASSLLAPQIKDSGLASAPRSETLASATMGLRGLERNLEGSPASLLFPEGLVDYLETVNRRTEDPNAMTRGMALLDVIP